MTIRNYELTGLVTLEDVADVLEKLAGGDWGTHDVDFGEAGYHSIDCDAGVDSEVIIRELARRVRSEPQVRS